MAISQTLGVKQSQSLAMTPQMQESIKILQMPLLDLWEYVDQELESNPFLEPETSDSDDEHNTLDDTHTSDASTPESLLDTSETSSWDDDTVSSAVYENNDNALNYAPSGNGVDQDIMHDTAHKPLTLYEHVTHQISLAIADEQQRIIAMHLADYLDDNGYLQCDLEELCTRLQCSLSQIEDVLSLVQTFEPVGIFARNLQECLTLQLKDKNRFDPIMEKVVNHLDLVATCEFETLQNICAVSSSELLEICQEVKALNPRPANDFFAKASFVTKPDIFLSRDNNNHWHIELNSDALPKLLANTRYYRNISQHARQDDDKAFLSQQFSKANWLVKALDQRANTIIKVASEIFTQQKVFFEKGVLHLKPLTLSVIAQNIEMHESTISRVVNGKFMATPMGLYELKYFFSSHIAHAEPNSEGVSSKVVKHLIKDLINKENPQKILSDEKIVLLLKSKGIDIARRTVMKYRESMHIGSSITRRKQKNTLRLNRKARSRAPAT